MAVDKLFIASHKFYLIDIQYKKSYPLLYLSLTNRR